VSKGVLRRDFCDLVVVFICHMPKVLGGKALVEGTADGCGVRDVGRSGSNASSTKACEKRSTVV
jgi:hypothetical protein